MGIKRRIAVWFNAENAKGVAELRTWIFGNHEKRENHES
jgi:hypothetical protein